MTEYSYNITTDVTGQALQSSKLHSEILGLNITGFQGIKTEGDDFYVIFDSDISTKDKTTLDTTIQNHTICSISQTILKRYSSSITLADDEVIELPISTTGFGIFSIGVELTCMFTYDASSTFINLSSPAPDVANSDTDGKLCIYRNGSMLCIKNRLGGEKIINVALNYS